MPNKLSIKIGVLMVLIITLGMNIKVFANEKTVSKTNDTGIPTISYLEGIYPLTKPIVIGKYKLDLFDIGVSEDSRKIRRITLFITNKTNLRERYFCNCSNIKYKNGSLSFKSGLTPMGIITINGKFIPQPNGWEWDKTIVLKGLITIEKDNRRIYSKEHEFMYDYDY